MTTKTITTKVLICDVCLRELPPNVALTGQPTEYNSEVYRLTRWSFYKDMVPMDTCEECQRELCKFIASRRKMQRTEEP